MLDVREREPPVFIPVHDHPRATGDCSAVEGGPRRPRRVRVHELRAAARVRLYRHLRVYAGNPPPLRPRRNPEPEAPVDEAFGGVERRQRLAALARLLELRAHHPRHNPPPPMRGHDRDVVYEPKRRASAGRDYRGRPRSRRPHDAPSVERGERPVRLAQRALQRDIFLRRVKAEPQPARAPPVGELVFRYRSDGYVHVRLHSPTAYRRRQA